MKIKECVKQLYIRLLNKVSQLNPKFIRIIFFFLLVAILFFFNYWINRQIIPSSSTENLWLYSGLMMVLFSMFFIEPYYTAPTNVISNSTAIILVLLSVLGEFTHKNIIWWYIGFIYVGFFFIISLLSTFIKDINESAQSSRNKISEILKNLSMRFGSGKILYSAIFLYFIFLNHSISDIKILSLMLFWWFIVVSDPQKFFIQLKNSNEKIDSEGEIISFQAKNVILAKLFQNTKNLKKFDKVIYRNETLESTSQIYNGLIVDNYTLNNERWIKILEIGKSEDVITKEINRNTIYQYRGKIKSEESINKVANKFVGIVLENSNISLIKFEYLKKIDDLKEGTLVEVTINSESVYYQVINGITHREKLSDRNESSSIIVEAIQIGTWNDKELRFEKYGWVPSINSLVCSVISSSKEYKISYPEYQIGYIPSTRLPAVINLKDAISHHLAILGVTGSGKSVISREIIKRILVDTKVICIDLTGEYIEKLKKLNPYPIIKQEGVGKVEEIICQKESAQKTKNSFEVLKYKKIVQQALDKYVSDFIELKESNLGLFELPDLSNTSLILEFTQMFLESIFRYAKKNTGQQICIVVEEAHTIIPESGSLGDIGEYGSNKAIVSKIGQIALQGRKYGVGFIIVAQRTANVSKTVLTQCNTVICFQAFDDTSFNFIGNYIGKDLVRTLPNLSQYNAVVAGKATKSKIPMIVDLTMKLEDDTQ